MACTHEEIMAGLPKARRAKIEARSEELHREVEGLKALRQLADRSQQQIAQAPRGLTTREGRAPECPGNRRHSG